jgi:ABC-type branched-subunit amino acid transport system substrate-binding protein
LEKRILAAFGNQSRPAIINTYRIPPKFLCKPQKEAAVITTSRFHAVLLALCAGALTFSNAAVAVDPIKIGVIASSDSHAPRDAFDVALKMINDSGGVLGRPFELVLREGQETPDQAAGAVQSLAEQNVAAIVGGGQAEPALAAVEIAHEKKIPYISDVGSHVVGAKLYPEVYNIGLSSSESADVIADNVKALGAKRVVAFTASSDAGVERANQLAQRLNSSDAGIQYTFETLSPNATDFAGVLQPHKSNPPDVVILMLPPPTAYALLKHLREQGIAPSAKTRIYDMVGLIDDPAFWDNAKDSAPGMLVLTQYHPQVTLPDLGKQFADTYRAKTGKEPTGMALTAADKLFVVAQAIKSGGSSEPEAITKALESLQWTGTRGKITFSADKAEGKFHQWLGVPVATVEITAIKQSLGETKLVQAPGQKLEPNALQKSN